MKHVKFWNLKTFGVGGENAKKCLKLMDMVAIFAMWPGPFGRSLMKAAHEILALIGQGPWRSLYMVDDDNASYYKLTW